MMSVTDKLRRLLDERGIKHSDHYMYTSWRDADGVLHVANEQIDKTLVLDCLTPEQAVAATSAERTCKMNVLDTGNEAAYEHYEYIMHCTKCNHEFGYVQYNEDGDTWMDEIPNYCPNCGARVIEE